jgi:hypothetical protein
MLVQLGSLVVSALLLQCCAPLSPMSLLEKRNVDLHNKHDEQVEPNREIRQPTKALQSPDLSNKHACDCIDDDADYVADGILRDLRDRLAA